MYSSIIIATAFIASAFAAPANPNLNLASAHPGSHSAVSDYFNMLAKKVQEAKQLPQGGPVCDLSSVQLPRVPGSKEPMPLPGAGYKLKHVALGRGTQNYTCSPNNATAIPAAAGAVATLFDASCIASAYPALLTELSRVTVNFNLTDLNTLAPSNLLVSGHHYFAPNITVPYFDLGPLGSCMAAKNASEPAPADAGKGQGGEPAVPWLKLTTREGATGDLQEVYRVGTAGGSPPATCKDMPATFEVQYTAQYWFYAGKKPTQE
ncbi:hypothetical protein PspLS_05658 [Pyricularia sp. CBS 133598]|nr:hypothetical protein PspLS_05658 [Pyricularia sp. CBS 133598]